MNLSLMGTVLDQIKAGDLLKKYEAGKIKTDIELQSL